MPDFEEVFEDLGENTKKVLKNKKFWIAAAVVGAAALFVGIRNNGRTASQEAEPMGAIGYAGYPTVGGSGASGTDSAEDSAYLDALISENSAYYESLMVDQKSEYDKLIMENNSYYSSEFDEMASNIESLSNRLVTTEETISKQREEIQKQQDLAQMKANSELYNALGSGDRETKDALHAENLAIAEKYGMTYDARTGNYRDSSGSVVYTTSAQQAKATTGAQTVSGKTAEKATVTFDKNVDYQAKINEAVKNGASSETINQLKAQRQAKIDAVYGGVDPDTKKKT